MLRNKIFGFFMVLFLSFKTNAQNLSNVKEPLINCSEVAGICPNICGDDGIQMSSTFCDPVSGSCVCDCRDVLGSSCVKTPFTPCFQDCVRKNPNPEVFLYEGGSCLVSSVTPPKEICACECSLRDDYVETNDVF